MLAVQALRNILMTCTYLAGGTASLGFILVSAFSPQIGFLDTLSEDGRGRYLLVAGLFFCAFLNFILAMRAFSHLG